MVTRAEAIRQLRRQYGNRIPATELQKLPLPEAGYVPQQITTTETPQQAQARVRARHQYERPRPTTPTLEPNRQAILQERSRVALLQKQIQRTPTGTQFTTGKETITREEAIRQLKQSTQSLQQYDKEVKDFDKQYASYLKEKSALEAKQKSETDRFIADVERIKWPYTDVNNNIPGTGKKLTPDMPVYSAKVIIAPDGTVTYEKPYGMPEALWQYQLATVMPPEQKMQLVYSDGTTKEISKSEYVQQMREEQDAYLVGKFYEVYETKNPLGYWAHTVTQTFLQPFKYGGMFIQEATGQLTPSKRYEMQAKSMVEATKAEKEQGILRFAPFYGVYSDLPTVAATYGGYGIATKAASPFITFAATQHPIATYAGLQTIRGGFTAFTGAQLGEIYKGYTTSKTPEEKAAYTSQFLSFAPFVGVSYSQLKKGFVTSKQFFTKGAAKIKGFAVPLKKTTWIGEGASGITGKNRDWDVNISGFTKTYAGRGKKIALTAEDVKIFEKKFGQATKLKPAKFKDFTLKITSEPPEFKATNIFEENIYYKPKKSLLGKKKIVVKEKQMLTERTLPVAADYGKPIKYFLTEPSQIGNMTDYNKLYKPPKTNVPGYKPTITTYKIGGDYGVNTYSKPFYSPEQFPQLYGKTWGKDKPQPIGKSGQQSLFMTPEVKSISLQKSKSYYKSLYATQEMATIKIPATAFKSELKLTGLALGSLATTKQVLTQKSSLKTLNMQATEQLKITAPLSIQKLALVQLQDLKMVQETAPRPTTLSVTATAPTTKIKVPVPFIITPPEPFKVPKRQPTGYHAYVKVHKKNVRVTPQPLLKQEAIGFGALITDTTASRYFNVKPTKAPPQSQPQYANVWNDIGYKFKQNKSNYEELPQFAQDTITEQHGKTVEPIAAPFFVGYQKPPTLHTKGKKQFIYSSFKPIKMNKGLKYKKGGLFL